MPIKVAVENGKEFRFVVYHYSGHTDVADVITSVMRALSDFAPNQRGRPGILGHVQIIDMSVAGIPWRSAARSYRP